MANNEGRLNDDSHQADSRKRLHEMRLLSKLENMGELSEVYGGLLEIKSVLGMMTESLVSFTGEVSNRVDDMPMDVNLEIVCKLTDLSRIAILAESRTRKLLEAMQPEDA